MLSAYCARRGRGPISYHAGSAANGSSIAIMNADGNQVQVNKRAAYLVAGLLKEYGWGTDRLRKHKDWTGKNCPSKLLTGGNWAGSIKMVEAAMTEGATLSLDVQAEQGSQDAAPDFDIDHGRLTAAVAEAAHAHEDAASPAEVAIARFREGFRDLIENLAGTADVGAPRLFFPQGINEIEFTLKPSEITVEVKGPQQGAGAGGTHGLVDDEEDTVPEDDADTLTAAAQHPVTSYLDDSTAVYGTHSAARRYGIALTIAVLNEVAEKYFAEYGVRLGIGDISKQNGGTISGHASHKLGVDVDVRVPRRDSQEKASNWKEASYSRERTQFLVNLYRNNGKFPIKYIFFNDPNVSGVSYWDHHDNHLHVRFDLAQHP